MKRRSLWLLLVLVLSASLIATWSCAGGGATSPPPSSPATSSPPPSSPPPSPLAPVKIGGLFELTGGLSFLGQESLNGATLALEEANYKVGGRDITFIKEDIDADPAVAMDKARKLVETDKVNLVFGPLFSAAVAAIAPYLNNAQMPAINQTGQPEEVPKTSNWMWLAVGTLGQMTNAMGHYAYTDLGYRTAATLATDYIAGREYMGGFIDGFQEAGGKVVQQQWSEFLALDLTPYLVKVEKADVLATWEVGDSLIPAMQQMRELGIWNKMAVVGASDAGLVDPAILDQVGDKAQGFITEAHYSRVFDTPGNKEFVAAYQKRFNVLPGAYAGNSYATMKIALQAIKNAGGDISNKGLAKALDAIDMDTIRGHVKFTPMHTAISEAFIIKIDKVDGKISPVPVARYQVWLEKQGDKLIKRTEKMK